MNNFFKQFKDEVRTITMSAHEKESMRNELRALFSPAPIQKHSPYYSFFSHSLTYVAFGLIGIIGGGVGISYAAHNTLPGDALYNFKVSVVEEITERTKFQPHERAAFAIDRMVKRIDEAEQLAQAGALTLEHQSALSHRAAHHAQTAYDILDRKERMSHDKSDGVHSYIHDRISTTMNHFAETDDLEATPETLLALAESVLEENYARQSERRLAQGNSRTEALQDISNKIFDIQNNIIDDEITESPETPIRRSSLEPSPSQEIRNLLSQAETKVREEKYFEALTLVRDAEMRNAQHEIMTVGLRDNEEQPLILSATEETADNSMYLSYIAENDVVTLVFANPLSEIVTYNFIESSDEKIDALLKDTKLTIDARMRDTLTLDIPESYFKEHEISLTFTLSTKTIEPQKVILELFN